MKKRNGNVKKYSLLTAGGGAICALLLFIIASSFFAPRLPFHTINPPEGALLNGTAATFTINKAIQTDFGSYDPLNPNFSASITPKRIAPDLSNVNLQGLSVPQQARSYLAQYGFVLVDEGYEDIYQIYEDPYDETPFFVTTDLVLHAYHVLYDLSLRVLEGTQFYYDFESLIETLQTEQLTLYDTVTASSVKQAVAKNIAYTSVILNLINATHHPIPSSIPEVQTMVTAELANINNLGRAFSAIFGYEEDFSQYKVRGHYTRHKILQQYFKAMMYAGRMSFLLQSPYGGLEMGINQTRMALLLLSSFNTTVHEQQTVWDYWDLVYEPTAFYVGASDDLTPKEYYTIWKGMGTPTGDHLANDSVISDFIDIAKSYRKPKINSMFVQDMYAHENVTQGFRLMGQRFIPDSYIFQQLVHNKVWGREFPSALDVFSVFGSPRAAHYQQDQNQTYLDYHPQITKLRDEFGNLTEYDWTQNLYWLWLYSLFPLLEPASAGYPGFMQSNNWWTDKALMTACGSWTELRHDTILYAKQSYTYERASIEPTKTIKGYIEPYPKLYARLASLARLTNNGLQQRNILPESFDGKLTGFANMLDRCVEISIKELENKPLTSDDMSFIKEFGTQIGELASYDDPLTEEWTNEADDRMAVVADVHTNPNSGEVLEEATGNPYTIYVVVQNEQGNLRLTKGGTYSYYEFAYPMSNRLTDEEWHTLLDTNPPELPSWVDISLPLISNIPSPNLVRQTLTITYIPSKPN